MRVLKVNNSVIELYESAEKMTMKRHQRFNKFLMIDNEVGSDFGDFNERMNGVVKFLKAGMREDAVKELENWRQCVYNSFSDYTPKSYALALLVHKIDGKVHKGIASSDLDIVLEKLEELGVTQETAEATVSEVKKK